ncbi:hypothetical protein DSCO28_04310 [Desulfosarcina ovata subsp. sediminis]|uniref:Recombinase domain-containing protein n=1 Tax=Desulfosarcina ovata subsp. sediminis TaxID=885957 RepID=A0A5K7ZHY0_9BACT|nr:hypothetical protein [Desulfosarcina ovata]BBO79865.1 hypothetical protein DSCO28_04310 [Desulfosarcina ovata subsp. sediminis]
MDDFLHNLRSGKLKQPDRGRRDYTDYKGPQRRTTGNDRRRTDYYAKVTNENFALIKETLDVLSENQKRIADTITAQTKMEERIANAIEALVTMMGRQWGHEGPLPQGVETVGRPPQGDTAEPLPVSAPAAAKPQASATDDSDANEDEPPSLIDMIANMRTEGDSWEKIARHFDNQQIPTVSGKGKWRGPAVKKFWDANSPK